MYPGNERPIASAADAPQRHQRYIPREVRTPRSSISVACSPCRLKKAKCDGVRPTCTRCNGLQLSCEYDVNQGVSRAERFKMQKQRQHNITNNLTALVDALRSGTDLEATTILARLRLGDSVEEIVQSLNANLYAQSEPTQHCAKEAKTPSALDTPQDVSDLESIAEHLVERPTHSVQLDITNRPRKMSVSTTAGQFLCVIFEREEFRLPGISREENDNHDRIDISNALLTTQHSPRMIQLDGLDDLTSSTHSIGQISSTFVTLKTTATVSGGGDAQECGSRIGYPEPQDGLATVPSFLVDQGMQTSHFLSSLSTRAFSIPSWAMLTVNIKSGLDSMDSAFTQILDSAATLLQGHTSQEDFFGSAPNIAALYDADEYSRSSVLSQWAASMVHSVKLKGHDFTCFASMYAFWYLMRWMISSSPETYEAIPNWLRPLPNQLFIPHMHMLDFVIWPKLRELAVSTPLMQRKMDWLIDLSNHIQCAWPFALTDSLRKDDETGRTVLTEQAEVLFTRMTATESKSHNNTTQKYMATLSNWTLAPSFRAYVRNADMYVSIRSENR